MDPVLIPFKFKEEILASLPKIYSENPQWFSVTPKFTTLRVNSLRYYPEELAEMIRIKLSEESLELGYNIPPEVFVCNNVRDCVVIGPLNTDSGKHILMHNGEVIVDVECGNAVLRGAHIFAPGVLSLPSNAQVGDMVDIYVDLKGMCRRGLTKLFCGDKVYIGFGVVKISRTTLFANNAKINGIAIDVSYRISKVPSLNLELGCGILQNFPSIICSHALEPTSESKVLDMCASPGNKTTHLAMLMKNKGQIIALDKTIKKINKVDKLCHLFGITNVTSFVCDSTKAVLNISDEIFNLPATTVGPPFCKEAFDRILLDAPCSALGHRPNLYNKISVKQLKSYNSLQKQLFHNAVELLKPGGILVYSTCTITIEENEGLVKWAVDKYSNLKLVKANPYIGSSGLIESGLSDEMRFCVQRFNVEPGDTPETDTIGFFISKFVKKES